MRRLATAVLSVIALTSAITGARISTALADDTLKVAVPQKGAWDAGIAELGKRGGIFKKHGLDLDILYTAAGPESIQAMIGGSIDVAVASGVSAAVGTFGKGAPIRIIGSEIVGAPDLYWYVPSASPIKKIEDALERDYFLTAEAAKDFGLIDQVIERRPEDPAVKAA